MRISLLIIWLFSANAIAWSGHDLFDALRKDRLSVSAAGYIYGVFDTTHSTDIHPDPNQSLCYHVPSDTFDIKEVMDVVWNYLLRRQDLLDKHAPQLIVMALNESFPTHSRCKYKFKYR